MKIKEVTDTAIIFDNGNKITYDHDAECCENNWADFSVLNPNVLNYDYDFNEKLEFRIVDGLGFLFGCIEKTQNPEFLWFEEIEHFIFIPCYSDQNGYYSDSISIYYNGECVIAEGSCCLMRA